MVRGSNFHGSREVEDDTVFMSRSCSPPSRLHSFADLNSKVRFGLGESFRTVLVSKLGSGSSGAFVGQPTNDFRVLGGQFDGLSFGVPEHDLSESRASGVIHVQNRFFASGHRFDGPPD